MDSNYRSVLCWWWWGGIFWREREVGTERFSREEGNERVVLVGWRKGKSELRGRVVGKVGGEESSGKSTRLDSRHLTALRNGK